MIDNDLFYELYINHNSMLILSLGLISILTYIICLKFASKTVIGRKASLAGPFFNYYLLEIPIYILPGIVIISSGYLDGYWFIANSSVQEYKQGFFLAILSLIIFSFSLYLLSIILPEKVLSRSLKSKVDATTLANSIIFLLAFTIIANTLIAKDWPMINGILGGDLKLRRSQVGAEYEGIPYLITFMRLCAFTGAALFGFLWSQKNKRICAIIILVLALLASSWTGAKGPAVSVILFSFFSYYYFSEKKLKLFKFGLFAVAAFIFAYFVYYIAMYQKHGENVTEYFLIRVFAGQIGGMYESLALKIHDFSYILHGLPFGGRFTDTNLFYKDLMIASEGGSLTSGVKNSLFVSEAFAIGGYTFAIFSGFLFAAGVIISCRITYLLLSLFLEKPLIPVFIFPLVNNMPLTGEFASVAFFGKFFVSIFYISIIIMSSYFFSIFRWQRRI